MKTPLPMLATLRCGSGGGRLATRCRWFWPPVKVSPCKLRPHHALWISTHCTLQISTLTRVEIGSLHSRTPTHHGVYPPWAPRSVTRRTICDTMYSLFAGEKLIADNAEYLATQHPHIRIRHHFKIGNALVEGQDRKYILHNTLYLHKENKCIRVPRCLKHEYIAIA